MAMTVVVTYDISEDRRRARVAAALQQHGDRVNGRCSSAFWTPTSLSELLARITEMINVAPIRYMRSGNASPAGRLSV